MPTKRESFGIFSGELRDTSISGTTPARDIFQDGQPLEMEFAVALKPEPGFPGTVTVVIEGSNVGRASRPSMARASPSTQPAGSSVVREGHLRVHTRAGRLAGATSPGISKAPFGRR